MVYQKFLITICLSFVFQISVFSKNLKIEEINTDLEAIQLIAMKQKENILKLETELDKYDVFYAKNDDWYRLFIVNITKNNLKNKLQEIRLLFPGAFVATKKVRDLFTQKTITQTPKVASEKEGQSIKMPELNTDTILKTRKKFF